MNKPVDFITVVIVKESLVLRIEIKTKFQPSFLKVSYSNVFVQLKRHETNLNGTPLHCPAKFIFSTLTKVFIQQASVS